MLLGPTQAESLCYMGFCDSIRPEIIISCASSQDIMIQFSEREAHHMIGKVFKLIRLPMLLIVIFTIGRFILSVKGVPYSPRSNAVFTILPLILISTFYFGALSGKVNGIGWVGAILLGVFIGFFGEF